MREEVDLSFADFGSNATGPIGPCECVSNVAIRRWTTRSSPADENSPELSARSRMGILERETGFEPATLTLAT